MMYIELWRWFCIWTILSTTDLPLCYKSPREKREVFDVVPKFSGATEPDIRLVGFIQAAFFLVCLPDV